MPALGNVRQKALLKLQSADQLDERVQVVNRWSWLALLAIATILAGVIVWAAISTLPTTVRGKGYVVPTAGWTGIQATVTGVVQPMVGPSAHVRAGQVIAEILANSNSKEVAIRTPTSGIVAESDIATGQFVQAGEQLMILSPSQTGYVVYAYFPVSSSRSIPPSAATNVTLDGTSAAAFGYIRGHIQSVATLPATDQRIQQVLQNSALTNQVTKNGPVVEVVVQLQPARTPSGYRWTEGRGPGFSPVQGGTPVHVSIVVDRKHPISYVL